MAPLSMTATSRHAVADAPPALAPLAKARVAAAMERMDFSRRRTTLFRRGERDPTSDALPGTGAAYGAKPAMTEIASARRAAREEGVEGSGPPVCDTGGEAGERGASS